MTVLLLEYVLEAVLHFVTVLELLIRLDLRSVVILNNSLFLLFITGLINQTLQALESTKLLLKSS